MGEYIKIRKLVKDYRTDGGSLRALDVDELSIGDGVFVLLRGKSGSGKTTLLNMIGLLDTPTSGAITVGGVDVLRLSEDRKAKMRRDIFGFAFQSSNLIPTLTLMENIAVPLLPLGREGKGRMKKAEEYLVRVGLEKKRKHLPSQLSAGEQQRGAIVRALVNDPKVVLADEPTANLDDHNTGLVMDLLVGYADEKKSVLIVAGDKVPTWRKIPGLEIKLEGGMPAKF